MPDMNMARALQERRHASSRVRRRSRDRVDQGVREVDDGVAGDATGQGTTRTDRLVTPGCRQVGATASASATRR